MNTDFEYLLGFGDRYKINRSGELIGCRYNNPLSPHLSRDGYLKICLHSDTAKNNKRSIHRLLAIQYIPNPDNLPEVDHIDRNKQNNDLSNLRWVSHSENARNRKDSLHLKTEEEWEDHVVKLREYKKIKAREYSAKKKANPVEETPEEREVRLARHREYCRKYSEKKANPEAFVKPPKVTPLTETPEQREERLAKSRERSHRSLEKKKKQQSVDI